MEKKFTYYLYSPCGNDTALVEGISINEQIRKELNDKIMKIHPNVEQVGFINKDEYKLVMAGGEFCGNATRCATYYYLKGKKGKIEINVSNNTVVESGIDEHGKVWSEIPLCNEKNILKKIDDDVYEININGIKYIILEKELSKNYLENKKNIKSNAMGIIKKYDIKDEKAIGIIFTEKIKMKIKIHPVIWVKAINTIFYETACGGGTTAVGILEAIKNNKSQYIDIIQPSNKIITANIILKKGTLDKAYISGVVKVDKIAKEISINL